MTLPKSLLLILAGGLQTRFSALKANAVLATMVALTGIAIPIALSFSLEPLASATPLQAFSAGAALCSTSLGTTFTILSTSGLSSTRLGVVLTTAAMMDDVVGLVMVQVISNLGEDSFTPITVVRPIAVSIGLGIVILLTCRFVAKPVTLWFNSKVRAKQDGRVARTARNTYTPVVIHTIILLGLVTGATYAGTSNLFAAYLAGASISWWDSEFSQRITPTNNAVSAGDRNGTCTERINEAPPHLANPAVIKGPASAPNPTATLVLASTSGAATFELFYGPILHRLFKPLFFASIGFAIPLTKLFSGPVVWRGIVYTILMLFAKLATGLWLVRFSGPIFPNFVLKSKIRDLSILGRAAKKKGEKRATNKGKETSTSQAGVMTTGNLSIQLHDVTDGTPQTSANANEGRKRAQRPKTKHINRPLSLYPAAVLGTAMTARGEIGFLIASLAETTGVFSSDISREPSQPSEIYLIVTWAIVLCTIIGPLIVGTLVKRIRRLDRDLVANGGGRREEGPLGIWGVD